LTLTPHYLFYAPQHSTVLKSSSFVCASSAFASSSFLFASTACASSFLLAAAALSDSSFLYSSATLASWFSWSLAFIFTPPSQAGSALSTVR
jgi:hypothetical protein